MGSAGWFATATETTETGRLAASVDWSDTPLGPPETWPTALRVAVETCFSTRFPVLVTWGPDLVKIYNDGYRELLGSEKHPGAMGSTVREVWVEIWDVIEPLFRQVLDTGVPTLMEDQLLYMDRNGFLEETYFTYSYSPIRDDDGSIGGVLDICVETTEQVVTARRLAVLGELRGALVMATTTRAVCEAAMEVLRDDHADIEAAAVHLIRLDTGELASSDEPLVGVEDVMRVVATGREELIGRVHLAPMGDVGALAVELNPARPYDEGYRSFIDLASSTIHMAILEVRRRMAELDELRRTSEVLQRAMLPGEPALPGIACRYLPAAGELTVGGDWYDVIDLGAGRVGLVVGDCVGHGLAAAATMGQLRSACRALLLQDLGPAAVLQALDRFADGVEGAESATVFCAVIDEAWGRLHYASAGHPAPLIVGGGEVRRVEEATGIPLAVVADRRREEAQVDLPPGASLVLYTDGLVERRGESLDVGFARLERLAAGLADGDPEELADRLLAGMLPADRSADDDDDVALVVYRRLSPGGG